MVLYSESSGVLVSTKVAAGEEVSGETLALLVTSSAAETSIR